MRRLIVMFAAFFLSACAARNPVLRQAEWEQLHTKPGGAVVFSLAQARFDLSYQFVTRTFTAGPFTNVVDHCLDDDYASKMPICAELKALGVNRPLRLSDRKKNFTPEQFCKKDGGGNRGSTRYCRRQCRRDIHGTGPRGGLPDTADTIVFSEL